MSGRLGADVLFLPSTFSSKLFVVDMGSQLIDSIIDKVGNFGNVLF